MTSKISQRLSAIINALPLRSDIRVLEIGCGTGVAASEIVKRFEGISVLGIDRSSKAITQALKRAGAAIEKGRLQFLQAKIEEFELPKGAQRFDLAFAVRVGALDGRHPEAEKAALLNIKKALKRKGKLFIDGGNPIREVTL